MYYLCSKHKGADQLWGSPRLGTEQQSADLSEQMKMLICTFFVCIGYMFSHDKSQIHLIPIFGTHQSSVHRCHFVTFCHAESHLKDDPRKF